jgi:hypothetical protein
MYRILPLNPLNLQRRILSFVAQPLADGLNEALSLTIHFISAIMPNLKVASNPTYNN